MGIEFMSVDSEKAWADVRREGEAVRLVVSIVSDGDYDVLLEPETARELADALVKAASEGA